MSWQSNEVERLFEKLQIEIEHVEDMKSKIQRLEALLRRVCENNVSDQWQIAKDIQTELGNK